MGSCIFQRLATRRGRGMESERGSGRHTLEWRARSSQLSLCRTSDHSITRYMDSYMYALTTSRSQLSLCRTSDHSITRYMDSYMYALTTSSTDSCVDACSVAVHRMNFSMSSLKLAIASRTPTSREKLATIVEFMSWSVAFPAHLRPCVASAAPFDVAYHACAICWIVATTAATCKIMVAQECHAMERPGCAQSSACTPLSHSGHDYASDWTRSCPVPK